MPISLPPISRRRFLAQSLAAAALTLGGGCLVPRRETAGESWALLSDIHIAADRKRMARAINMTDNLMAVTKDVLALPQTPRAVLVSGDLAFNSGETADYAAVMDLLQPLRQGGLPIHLALGNHDHRERFWNAMRHDKSVQRSLADKQVAILRGHNANWFVLDSLVKTLHTPGVLGDAQRAWLARALDHNADKPALIVIHHNPNNGFSGALDDTEELLEILRPRRHVKAYFFGHTHRWDLSRDESGIHLINLPPVAYLFDASLPNGWVHATLRTEGISLELRCLNHAHKDHGQITDLKWREG